MKSKSGVVLIVSCLVAVAILAGLGGLWYYTSTLDRSGWVQQNGYYYYLNEDGDPLSGWMEEDGKLYYFGESCAMVTGWQQIEGSRYYFSTGGVMQTGWLEQEGVLRYLNSSGNPVSGWQNVDGLRRWFLDDGILATGWQTIDGVRCYLSEEGTLVTGWLKKSEGIYYLNEQGSPIGGLAELEGDTYYFYENSGLMATGMLDLEFGRCYFGEDGKMYTGWQTMDGKTFYFAENGAMHTGWLQEDEYRYYFQEDGSMVNTPTEIDGQMCYFTPAGIYVLLVNYRNPMPENYDRDLVYYNDWARVNATAEPHLRQMILDCRATGVECWLNCGYRTYEEQTEILNSRTKENQAKGLSYQEAYNRALETVAIPGYSEHETGLAMDIVGSVMLTWLHEHCWEYGFILRYPEGKSDITGISYEHWHYRYVGTKVSMAMKDTGLTLEEYIGAA